MAKYRVDVLNQPKTTLGTLFGILLLAVSSHIGNSYDGAFEEAMLSLSDMPQRCPLVSDDRLSQMGYRKLIVKITLCFS